ncbi:MAG: hypothetical protein U0270_45005 [Labilithrix sp.]
MDNPFERYELDPREGISAITQKLKELAEDAKDDAEREAIRAAWEELTLHPARRLRAALFAHPETRPELGNPPALGRRRAAEPIAFHLHDIAPRSTVEISLGGFDDREVERVPSLDEDPILDLP